MARLIRMDSSGHTMLAEWTARGRRRFRGRRARVSRPAGAGLHRDRSGRAGKATHVRALPREVDLVIMRRPIAGGSSGERR